MKKERIDGITYLAVGVQLLGICLCTFVLLAFIGRPLRATGQPGLGLIISVLLGIIVWTLILFSTPLFRWWFINIKPNHSVVLGSQLTRDVIPQNVAERTKMFAKASLRETGSGIRGKLPWEVVVKIINMQSEILIGTPDDSPLIVYTKQGEEIELEIKWQVTLTPLPGFMTNLVRHTEANIIAFFKGECEAFIISWAKSRSEQEIMEKIGNDLSFALEFKKLFGGADKVDKREEDYGVWTNDPQIVSIKRSKRYQESAEAKQVSKNIGSTLEELKKSLGDVENLDPNTLLLAGLAVSGRADGLNTLIVTGLQNADPRVLANLGIIGDIADKTKKKGKK